MSDEQTLTTPGLVHPVLTEDQAQLVHQALIAFLNLPEGSHGSSIDPEMNQLEDKQVRDMLSELVYFFSNVVDHPESFGVRSAMETKRLIRAAKPVRGEAKPRRRKRQTGRGQRKKNSRATREEAEAYNEAVRKIEAERLEAEQNNSEEMVKRIERSNELLVRDDLSNEELQELLEILGFGNVAEAARLMRAENTPEARIERAVEQGRRENPED
jgi:hypothetical protein